MNAEHKGTVAFALCGSFCTFEAAVPQAARLAALGWQVLPVMSFAAASTDTRFGPAAGWKARLEAAAGRPVLETLAAVEPLGPQRLADALVIAPCTGATLARLAAGLSDTPVALAAKSLLRAGRPVVVAVSTNDGLGRSAANIGALLAMKHIFFAPFRQDDFTAKPDSLVADFALIPEAAEAALRGKQMQPLLLPGQSSAEKM